MAIQAEMDTPKFYRWGIIGCGRVSHDFANCLDSHNRSHIVACAARSKRSAVNFAQKFDIATSYDSYGAIIADPNVDIIYIGTINITHYDIAIKALNSGKHVIVEKPMGINAQQYSEIIDAARKNQRFLMEAMWTRFFPAVRKARQWMAEGRLGDIVMFEGNFGLKKAGPAERPNSWSNELAGGGLLDIGIYPLQYLPMLFGNKMPDELKANGILKHGVDAMSSATMTYGNDQFASVHCTMMGATSQEYVIVGKKARIRMSSHTPMEITIENFGFGTQSRFVTSSERQWWDKPEGFKRDFHMPLSEGFIFEIDGIVRALDEKRLEAPEYTWDEMLTVARLSDEIRLQIGLSFPQDRVKKTEVSQPRLDELLKNSEKMQRLANALKKQLAALEKATAEDKRPLGIEEETRMVMVNKILAVREQVLMMQSESEELQLKNEELEKEKTKLGFQIEHTKSALASFQ